MEVRRNVLACSQFVLAILASETNVCPTLLNKVSDLTSHPYDAAAHPNLRVGSTRVQVQLYLNSITEISQRQQQIQVEGFFREAWSDHRLAYSNDSTNQCEVAEMDLPESTWSRIWTPDLYFDNAVEPIKVGEGLMTVSPSGNIYRSRRFFQKFSCLMHFAHLPFDRQRCRIAIASYSKSTRDLSVETKDQIGVQFPEGYTGTTEFSLAGLEAERKTVWYGSGPDRKGYDFILLDIHLKRRHDSFLRNYVVQSFLLGLASWSGTFVDRGSAPARVSIAVITALCLLNLKNNIDSILPPLSYNTWLTDFVNYIQWLCMIAMFEFGLVCLLMKREEMCSKRFEALVEVARKAKHTLDQPTQGASACSEIQDNVWSPDDDDIPTPTSPIQISIPSQTSCREEFLASLMSAERDRIYSIFNVNKAGKVSVSQIRRGFRQLGHHFSTDQVKEIFANMEIAPGDEVEAESLIDMLMDVKNRMPKTLRSSFLDRPPSDQVDTAFRVVFIVALLCILIGFLLTIPRD